MNINFDAFINLCDFNNMICNIESDVNSYSIDLRNLYYENDLRIDRIDEIFKKFIYKDFKPQIYIDHDVIIYPEDGYYLFQSDKKRLPNYHKCFNILPYKTYDYCDDFVILCCHPQDSGYYHYLCQSFASALYCSKRFNDAKIIYNSKYKFASESIKYLSGKPIPLPTKNPLILANALSTDFMNNRPPRLVLDLFDNIKINSNKKYPAHIYISRKKAIRGIINEDELLTMLEKYGFVSFCLEDMTFDEQIALFKSAEFIIAPHGAGLSNIVFSNKCKRIIEIFHPNLLDPGFLLIALAKNIPWQGFICQSQINKNEENYIKVQIWKKLLIFLLIKDYQIVNIFLKKILLLK